MADTKRQAPRVALDANCFIDAVTPSAHGHEAMRRIFVAQDKYQIALFVSRQTLHELEARPDEALALARKIKTLPHYSIGTYDEQVGTWSEEAGTWDDGREDDLRQDIMAKQAKSGNDIRDRGALIDALRANCDVFVTSDGQLSKTGPAQRLESKFPIRIRTPAQFVTEFID
jgi:predicted nucleic acid-binding protein